MDAGEFVENLEILLARQAKFGCIYMDPPWPYENQGTRGSTKHHYKTMSLAELAALPIGDLALPQSHLHLWVTNAFLFETPKLFEAWGFAFKSSLIWVKPQLGMGNYYRNAHEFLLLAIRGNQRACDRSIRSWIEAKRFTHSTKPPVVRSILRRLSPGPYLELFGRDAIPGWTVWGNEEKHEYIPDFFLDAEPA